MVYILLGTGFEEMEALTPCDLLRRGGEDVRLVSVGEKLVVGGHGIAVEADLCLDDTTPLPDMVVLPGGLGGVKSLGESKPAMDMVTAVWERGGYVAAICAAPTLLAKLGLAQGRKATCYPGMEAEMTGARMQNTAVTRDGRLLCGRAAGAATEFGLLLLETLRGRETAETVSRGIVFAPCKEEL